MAPLVLMQGLSTPANSAFAVSGGAPAPEIVTLLQENFNDNNAGLTARGWYDGNAATITGTTPYEGAGALRASFSAGGTNPSWVSKRHLFTPTETLYVSFRVRYSTNWIGSGANFHPHEIMLLSDQDGDFAGLSENVLNCYIEHNWQSGGYAQIQMQDSLRINLDEGAVPNDLTATHENRSTCGCNGVDEPTSFTPDCFLLGDNYYSAKVFRSAAVAFSNTPSDPNYKNNWNHVEVLMEMNTADSVSSTNDGILKYWINGNLLIDRSDIHYRTATHPELKWKQIIIAPYMEPGSGSPVAQTVDYDALTIATGRVAPPEVPPGIALTFIQTPVNTLEDTVITPAITVGVRDSLGNIVTTASHLVTMSIGSGTGALGGDTTKNAVSGIATFDDLQIDTPGPFSLLATASGLTSVSSPVFDIDEVTGGPSGWPNEPQGGTLLNEWNHSDAIPASGEVAIGSSGWTRIAFQPGTIGLVTDSPGDPQSPPLCTQIGFPAGFSSAGLEPATMFRNIGGGNDIYWGLYWKPSNPFAQHQSNVHKIVFQFLGGGGAGGQFYIQMHGTGGSGFLRMTMELSTAPDYNLDPNVNTTSIVLGVWHRIEMRYRKSPSLLQWWLDGILQGNYTSVSWPANGFGEAKFAPTWGGSGGPTASVASYHRFGHTRMKRIS